MKTRKTSLQAVEHPQKVAKKNFIPWSIFKKKILRCAIRCLKKSFGPFFPHRTSIPKYYKIMLEKKNETNIFDDV